MTKKEKLYFFANWKMYLNFNESVALAKRLAKAAKDFPEQVEMTVFPGALAIEEVVKELKKSKIAVGAQNVYWVEEGGYTGEISVEMFKRIGCTHSLVGHSERRHIFHETNREVRKKVEAILTDGLTPVLCVGETIEERRAGQTEKVVEIQLRAALGDLKWPKDRHLFIAYEPVWAIGTGLACDADEAERMHKLTQKLAGGLVRGSVEPVFLYGGSVRPENVAEYLVKEPIHGILVGGSSVKIESWLKIVKAVFY